uniref:EF-hand domain-containing protein n=1 Tax=Nelumbo nucifera TaxID=4432 RepID=A0A822XPW2_NELNU|nr:TPA_asm: hypothetical protein HUJ06_023830 [Nelumbo nucifera]
MATSGCSAQTKSGAGKDKGEVLDGSDIMELVENKDVFTNFVDHKFQELDRDKDGKLSLKELQPAVADIGAALGLPAQGTSPDSDHIYSEVLNEFTHGTQQVSKTGFKEVLLDILIGMATGLKRDPIVILRIDGEDLIEFINSPSFEPEMVSIFSQIQPTDRSLRNYITRALEQLTVDHGMPPSSDSWVLSNIVEPALQPCAINDHENPLSQETLLQEFKKVVQRVAQHLKEQPVIVAHTENTFDGSSIKRLQSNKFELDKVDRVVNEVFTMVKADDGKAVPEEEFKKIVTEILGCIMLQLEGNPISVSSNSVIHEPLTSSTLLPSSSS